VVCTEFMHKCKCVSTCLITERSQQTYCLRQHTLLLIPGPSYTPGQLQVWPAAHLTWDGTLRGHSSHPLTHCPATTMPSQHLPSLCPSQVCSMSVWSCRCSAAE
jgi:hypothetical protein